MNYPCDKVLPGVKTLVRCKYAIAQRDRMSRSAPGPVCFFVQTRYCIFFGNKRHVGASFISLAPTFVAKVRAHSCRCSSFPNRTRFAGLQFSFGCKLGNCGIYTVSIFQKERHTKRCVSLLVMQIPTGSASPADRFCRM
mgnify:CR=1 FL=1